MSKMENVKIVAKKRMWTIFVMLFYLLFDIICIFGFISDWDSTMFWVALIISIVLFPMLIHKIFSPKEILLFDNENKMFVVNKMFKSIKLPLENILSYYFNIKYSILIFRMKNKKIVFLNGIKKIEFVRDYLDKYIKREYSWWS